MISGRATVMEPEVHKSDRKALFVIQSGVRAGSRTMDSLLRVGLRHLDADLAYCGPTVTDQNNPYSEMLSYTWTIDEPDNVVGYLQSSLPATIFDFFINENNPRGLALSKTSQQLWVSGLIQWHYRKHALEKIQEYGLDKKYSHVIFARSDYLWTSPLPPSGELVPESLVALDGDSYGGINDRLLIFPAELIQKMSRVYDLNCLGDPVKLESIRDFLRSSRRRNPETLLLFQFLENGLDKSAWLIPQLGFLVRPPDVSSRWSPGVFNPRRNLFIKYPTELLVAKFAKTFFVKKSGHTAVPQTRSAQSRRPVYVRFADLAADHPFTLLAPGLLLVGEMSVAVGLYRQAVGRRIRKAKRFFGLLSASGSK